MAASPPSFSCVSMSNFHSPIGAFTDAFTKISSTLPCCESSEQLHCDGSPWSKGSSLSGVPINVPCPLLGLGSSANVKMKLTKSFELNGRLKLRINLNVWPRRTTRVDSRPLIPSRCINSNLSVWWSRPFRSRQKSNERMYNGPDTPAPQINDKTIDD